MPLVISSPAQRCGSRTAAMCTTPPPRSCPTRTARSIPSWASQAFSRSACAPTEMSRSRPAGMLSPYPVISNARTCIPVSRGSTCRHSAGEVGMPCTSTTGRPVPCSSQRTGVPATSTVCSETICFPFASWSSDRSCPTDPGTVADLAADLHHVAESRARLGTRLRVACDLARKVVDARHRQVRHREVRHREVRRVPSSTRARGQGGVEGAADGQ